MDLEIRVSAGDRVEARGDGWTIVTDQNGTVPAPFDLFLASIGTCAGYFVSRFCRQRGLPTEGIRVRQQAALDPATHRVLRIDLLVELPPDFPTRYEQAVLRAAALCSVKRHLEHPPAIEIHTRVAEAVGPAASGTRSA